MLGAVWVEGLPAFWPDNEVVPLFTSSIGLLVSADVLPRWLHPGRQRRPQPHRQRRRTPPRTHSAETASTVSPRPVSVVHREAREIPHVVLSHLRREGQVRWAHRRRRRVDRSPARRDRRAHRHQRRRQVDVHERSRRLRALDRPDRTPRRRSSARSRRPPGPRPGSAAPSKSATLFPELTVRQTIQVALEARRRSSFIRSALFLDGRVEQRPAGRGRRTHRLPRPRPLRQQLHQRPLHRHPPHRRAGRPARRRRQAPSASTSPPPVSPSARPKPSGRSSRRSAANSAPRC